MLAPLPRPDRRPPAWPLGERVHALEAAFRAVQHQRMAGVPLLHPRLSVRAVGFAEEAPACGPAGAVAAAGAPGASGASGASGADGAALAAGAPRMALGVLVTPWFMNLIRLPLSVAAVDSLPAPGAKQTLDIGGHAFEFIGAEEARVGRYALCSLFSPMQDFIDQAGAVATADALLALLRQPAAAPAAGLPAPGLSASPPTPSTPSTPTKPPAPPPDASAPARRGFLFGRSAAGGGRR